MTTDDEVRDARENREAATRAAIDAIRPRREKLTRRRKVGCAVGFLVGAVLAVAEVLVLGKEIASWFGWLGG